MKFQCHQQAEERKKSPKLPRSFTTFKKFTEINSDTICQKYKMFTTNFFTNPDPQFQIIMNMSINKALVCLSLLLFLFSSKKSVRRVEFMIMYKKVPLLYVCLFHLHNFRKKRIKVFYMMEKNVNFWSNFYHRHGILEPSPFSFLSLYRSTIAQCSNKISTNYSTGLISHKQTCAVIG